MSTALVSDTEKRVTACLAALRGARACYEHSPNNETLRLVQNAEQKLNNWLDRLPR